MIPYKSYLIYVYSISTTVYAEILSEYQKFEYECLKRTSFALVGVYWNKRNNGRNACPVPSSPLAPHPPPSLPHLAALLPFYLPHCPPSFTVVVAHEHNRIKSIYISFLCCSAAFNWILINFIMHYVQNPSAIMCVYSPMPIMDAFSSYLLVFIRYVRAPSHTQGCSFQAMKQWFQSVQSFCSNYYQTHKHLAWKHFYWCVLSEQTLFALQHLNVRRVRHWHSATK